MNQQVNQPPPQGQDPKLRLNQPPVNQQVPVSQGAADQAVAQAAAQAAQQQQGQVPQQQVMP